MLKRIEIENFKSLKHIDFKCAGLNLLMGLNGAGKSSFVQLLLLLREVASKSGVHVARGSISLRENAELSIGSFEDLKYCYSGRRDKVTVLESFCPWSSGDRSLCMQWIFERGGVHELKYICEDFNKWMRTNVSFERVGKALSNSPGKVSNRHIAKERTYEPKWHSILGSLIDLTKNREKLWKNSQVVLSDRGRPHQTFGEHGETPWISPNGSNLGEYLSIYAGHVFVGNMRELSPLQYPGSSRIDSDGYVKGNALKRQIEHWMNEIAPGAQLLVDKVNVSDERKYVVSVSFKGGGNPQRYRPQNVGFGISNIAPVIIALLTAEPKSIVIIENPEAHLHPKGQAAMGNLIARAVASGVQVFVETHSDHVVNGIRSAVKDGIVKPSDVNIAFFERKEHDVLNDDGTTHQEIYSEVRNIRVDKNGSLSEYPDGFMDEWNNQLMELI